MKVLFIAFEFPPLATGGVQRSVKFAKYLAEFGVEPVVVTTDLESFRQIMPDSAVDELLLDQIPQGLVIERVPCHRTKVMRPGRFAEWRRIYFSVVEDYAEQWWPHLNAALPGIIAKHKPQAIYVTVPPFCMAGLGLKVAKQYDLPLVLDLRDAWSQWIVSPYGSWLHYWIIKRNEGTCLKTADRLICTSNQTRADFLRIHPTVAPEKIEVITNGYDQTIEDWTLDQTSKTGDFVIGYVGLFYYSPVARENMMRPWWKKRPNRMIQYAPRKEDWLYRSPFFFFKAVALLVQKHPEHRKRLRIRFAGQKPDWIDAQVSEFGLTDLVEFVGRLDHPSVIQFQKRCDALLVTSSKIIGGNDYSIAGKTFEYFSLKKPVIGFVAEGAQKELLASSGMAMICDPDDSEKSAEQLGSLLVGRTGLKPNVEFLKQLHRRELTRRLADTIKATVEKFQV